MEEIQIPTARGEIYGRAAGDLAAPLVLGLHGWSQRNGWHTWEGFLAPLAGAGFRAISIDMPGWGKSPAWEKIPGKSTVSIILESLNRDLFAILGKSWGGGIALDFALSFPDQVARLILSAPAFRGTPGDLKRLTQPVLLAWAEDDPVIPIKQGDLLARAIPNCAFERYPSGGHSAAKENAADFIPKAIVFLQNKPPAISQ